MAEEQQSVLKVLVELVDQITEPLHKINESFEEFAENTHNLWQSAAEIFGGYEAIEGLVEPAVAFAQVQERLGLATGGSAEQLREFKEQAEDLSRTFPQNLEDITKAQTELFQTFRNLEDTKAATEVAAKLATVLGTDTATGANILSSAIENLGEKNKPIGEQMETLSDKLAVLNTRFPSGAAGASRMAMELARLGASARTYGITQNQIFAVWGELNRLHVGGARGAGQFAQQLIHSLAEVNDKGVPALQKYGLQIVKTKHGHLNLIATLEHMSKMSPAALGKLEEHFQGQGQALSSLVEHLDEVKAAYGDFLNSGGAADKAAKALSETPQAKLERLKNTVANLADTIGTQLLPQLMYVVDRTAAFIHWIDAFLDKHPLVTKAVGDFATGLAGVLILAGLWNVGRMTLGLVRLAANISGVTTLIGMMGNAWAAAALVAEEGLSALGPAMLLAFESNPIGWILTGLAAIALVSYEIWKHWDDIAAAIREASDLVRNFVSFGGISDYARIAGDLATGNIGQAGSDFGAVGAAHMNYAPTVHVHMGNSNASPQAVGSAVRGALSSHADDLHAMLQESSHDMARRSFADTTLRGAH